jgi:two-component system LytT family response regulator
MTIRVAIAEDEPAARARIRRFLKAEEGVDIVAECADGEATVAAISSSTPDVLFLDIEMPILDGFGVLKQLPNVKQPLVVFVSAYPKYAIRAFDVEAADFLQKPVDEARFRLTFQRIRERLAQGPRDNAEFYGVLQQLLTEQERLREIMTNSRSRYVDRLTVRSRERMLFVRVNDVDWFESTGNYVKLHTAKATHLIRETLAGLEKRLDPDRFLRIHRQTIVNLERISEVQPYFSGDYVVVLISGVRLKLSRTYKSVLDKQMGQKT